MDPSNAESPQAANTFAHGRTWAILILAFGSLMALSVIANERNTVIFLAPNADRSEVRANNSGNPASLSQQVNGRSAVMFWQYGGGAFVLLTGIIAISLGIRRVQSPVSLAGFGVLATFFISAVPTAVETPYYRSDLSNSQDDLVHIHGVAAFHDPLLKALNAKTTPLAPGWLPVFEFILQAILMFLAWRVLIGTLAKQSNDAIRSPRDPMAARVFFLWSFCFGCIACFLLIAYEQEIFRTLNLHSIMQDLRYGYVPATSDTQYFRTQIERGLDQETGAAFHNLQAPVPTWSLAMNRAWDEHSVSRLPQIWSFWLGCVASWGMYWVYWWARGSPHPVKKTVVGTLLVASMVLAPALLETGLRAVGIKTWEPTTAKLLGV